MGTLLLGASSIPHGDRDAAPREEVQSGEYPAHLGRRTNQMCTVRALVEAGCDITIRGYKNKTAAEQAATAGHRAHRKYFRSTRFLRSSRDESGQLRRVKVRRGRWSATSWRLAFFPLARCPSLKSLPRGALDTYAGTLIIVTP